VQHYENKRLSKIIIENIENLRYLILSEQINQKFYEIGMIHVENPGNGNEITFIPKSLQKHVSYLH
jgi:hypothetical protein